MKTIWTYRVLNCWTDRYTGINEVHYQIYRNGDSYYKHGNPGIVRSESDFAYHVRDMGVQA